MFAVSVMIPSAGGVGESRRGVLRESPVTGRRFGVGEAVSFWRGFGGEPLVPAANPRRARFSAFSAAFACLVFSASACMSLSASRRAPYAYLALTAIAFELAAACLLISRVGSINFASAFPLHAADLPGVGVV